jgi:hypothetical protein
MKSLANKSSPSMHALHDVPKGSRAKKYYTQNQYLQESADDGFSFGVLHLPTHRFVKYCCTYTKHKILLVFMRQQLHGLQILRARRKKDHPELERRGERKYKYNNNNDGRWDTLELTKINGTLISRKTQNNSCGS